jgi:hypothetical protein
VKRLVDPRGIFSCHNCVGESNSTITAAHTSDSDPSAAERVAVGKDVGAPRSGNLYLSPSKHVFLGR